MNLDGGSSVTVNGPSGSVILNGSNGNPVEINAAGKFLGPGVYTVTGTGGADVGPFRATLTILAVPTLASPSNAASLTVTRSSGMTVGWKGGDPSGNVQLTVVSATDATFTIGASATCTVPASAGTFTIPPYVLLALPAGNFGALFFGSAESQVPFTAPGLSVGTLHTETVNAGLGYFVLK